MIFVNTDVYGDKLISDEDVCLIRFFCDTSVRNVVCGRFCKIVIVFIIHQHISRSVKQVIVDVKTSPSKTLAADILKQVNSHACNFLCSLSGITQD